MHPVNRNFRTVCTSDWSMRVAFASSDYHHVDQHFGATPRIVVYGVREDQVTLLKVVDFTVVCGHQEQKLNSRIEALEDCVSLYCVAIGDVVFRQLLQVGVRAVRVSPGTPIAQLLEQIQACWAENEQRTQRRQREPDRFERLLQETHWEEDASQ
ncbi:NifB/NifX family molybdenum-iron cluster-binding protein [Mangrovibacter yixingensis]|uniref:NifB/NifX family molybdenum-iron cluster-binding protein n=1 Tax=Mangrovibacter yixingensis TaxID=1529639 RepID=UPI001CFB9816|nr:NifB/NifX family molybdenum-iron cluster-binding protein [Mangrovibacter yixingensis]